MLAVRYGEFVDDDNAAKGTAGGDSDGGGNSTTGTTVPSEPGSPDQSCDNNAAYIRIRNLEEKVDTLQKKIASSQQSLETKLDMLLSKQQK